MREFPAADGIALYDANVPVKRLWCEKKRNHHPRLRPGFPAVLALGSHHFLKDGVEAPSQAPPGVMALQLGQI